MLLSSQTTSNLDSYDRYGHARPDRRIPQTTDRQPRTPNNRRALQSARVLQILKRPVITVAVVLLLPLGCNRHDVSRTDSPPESQPGEDQTSLVTSVPLTAPAERDAGQPLFSRLHPERRCQLPHRERPDPDLVREGHSAFQYPFSGQGLRVAPADGSSPSVWRRSRCSVSTTAWSASGCSLGRFRSSDMA